MKGGIKVSMVSDVFSTPTRTVDAMVVLKAIRDGKWEVKVARIRSRYALELERTGSHKEAKGAVKLLKTELRGVMWSGTFSQRGNDYLLEYSGLFCADIDGLTSKLQQQAIRARLEKSPYVWAVFLSPSGYGLKVIFRVSADASKHDGNYRAVERHILELVDVQIDESGKDQARLCFVSYDPDAYLNTDAQDITSLPIPASKTSDTRPSAERNNKPDKAQIRDMLGVIPKRLDYADWIRIVAAVGDALPDEDAIELLKEWSPEEREGEYAEKLRHRLENVHVGTLIHLAKQHGWRPKIAQVEKRPDLWKGPEVEPHNTELTPDEETFRRLAALSRTDYDRCRKDEAKRLGLRPGTLDAEVSARRAPHDPGTQGSAVEFPKIEPWPEPVNGADVLNEAAATFFRYLVLPSGAADALALWAAHTHTFEAFVHTPRLNFRSPERGCGKSTGLDVVASITPRPLQTENMTAAVLFRLVEAHKPILLLDEVDTYLNESDELRGLLNAGHKRGAKAYRCEGENNTVCGFAAFAPAALAGIGPLPGTLHDRAIVVRLAKAKPNEVVARFDSRRIEREIELCRKLAHWAGDNFEKLKNCDPQLPETAFNRVADNWRPLFAVAEVAGGDWPNRAREAFTRLTSTDDLEARGIGTTLLADIADIFTASNIDKIFSAQLCDELAAIEGRPWAEWGRQRKPISKNQLATQLRRFSVSPHEIRIGDKTGRGYELADFEDAFLRYLADTPFPDRNSETLRGKTVVSEVKKEETMFHPENGHPQRECFSVSLQKGDTSKNADSGEPDVEPISADVDAFLPDGEQSAGQEKLRL
jgi:putative DNA primase/helicase